MSSLPDFFAARMIKNMHKNEVPLAHLLSGCCDMAATVTPAHRAEIRDAVAVVTDAPVIWSACEQKRSASMERNDRKARRSAPVTPDLLSHLAPGGQHVMAISPSRWGASAFQEGKREGRRPVRQVALSSLSALDTPGKGAYNEAEKG